MKHRRMIAALAGICMLFSSMSCGMESEVWGAEAVQETLSANQTLLSERMEETASEHNIACDEGDYVRQSIMNHRKETI